MPASRESSVERQAAAYAVWSSLIVIATVLVARRWSGAMGAPATAWPACLAATLGIVFSAAASIVHRATPSAISSVGRDVLTGLLTLAPPLVIGIALLPSGSTFGIWYLGGLVVLASIALVVTSSVEAGDSMRTAPKDDVAVSPPSTSSVASDASGFDDDRPVVAALESETDRLVSQWMNRGRSADGVETIEGAVTVSFLPDQKVAVVHVPIQPPMNGVPEVECEVLDGADVRIRVAARFGYGIRLEARRSADVESSADVEVGFAIADAQAMKQVA